MSQIKITIYTDNDAFSGDDKNIEIARMLRKIAYRYENNIETYRVLDINGNDVCTIEEK